MNSGTSVLYVFIQLKLVKVALLYVDDSQTSAWQESIVPAQLEDQTSRSR